MSAGNNKDKKTPLTSSFEDARSDSEKLAMIYLSLQHVSGRVDSIERSINGGERAENGMVIRLDRLERDAASLNRIVGKLGGLVWTLVGSALTTILGLLIHYFIGSKS